MDDTIEKLLTVDDAAKTLSLSRSFVYKLIQERAFPVVRVGKATRVRPQDLRAFVDRLIEDQSRDEQPAVTN